MLPVAVCFLFFPMIVPACAGMEVIATRSLTVQPTGPRPGDAGSKYLNIEGKDNDKYASFGVLVFDIPEDAQGKPIKGLSLNLVQSIPKFARDGGIKFFLASDLDPNAELKFDPGASDGVGSQIKDLHPLGSGNFNKIETGKLESFNLTVDESVRGRIAKGGRICLVIVPSDATVAATYFGTAEDAKDKSPRLVLDMP
jgi:hypothetical protein